MLKSKSIAPCIVGEDSEQAESRWIQAARRIKVTKVRKHIKVVKVRKHIKVVEVI